jgi:hypothetical protein
MVRRPTKECVMGMEYAELLKKSLRMDELKEVYDAMQAVSKLPMTLDGTLRVLDEAGEPIAEIWYDSERELWKVLFDIGDGDD